MKQFYALKWLVCIAASLFLKGNTLAQQMTLSFENAEIVDQGGFFTYEVDVFIASDTDFKLGSGQVYLNYSTAAFGASVFTNGNINITQPAGSILGATFGFPAYRDFITNDNTSARVSFAFQQGISAGTIPSDNVTATPTLLFHVSMVMTDSLIDPNVCFESGDLFDDQFFTACGPSAPGFPDCTNNPGVQITNDIFDCNGATPAGCQAVTIWDGSDWSNGFPSITKNVIINGSYVIGDSDDEESFSACSLTINAGYFVEISTDNYIIVENDIILESSASPDDNGGVLVVEDGGSLIQINDDAQVVNGGVVALQNNYASLDNRDFVITGSPLTNLDREDYTFEDAIQFRSHSTANFNPSATVAAFDPFAENFADDDGNNWLAHTGLINPGEGYLVMPQDAPTVPDDQSYDIVYFGEAGVNDATFNNGVVNFDVVFGDDQNDSPNFLSNPYPSEIDLDALTIANSSLFDTYYFWEHLSAPSDTYPGYNGANYDMGDISMYTPGSGGVAAANGGEIPDQFLSPGEGFAVKAKTSGTAVFNNSMRVLIKNDGGKSSALGKDRIWLTVENNMYKLGSQTLVAFIDGASENFESFYDANRLATAVSLYSVLDSGEELAIQGRQAFSMEDEVALGFRSQIEENSSYSISIAQMESFLMDETVAVYLEDKYEGTLTNLSEGDYNFTSGPGTFNDRFVLVFREKTLGDNNISAAEFSLWPNPSNGIFSLNTGNAQVEKVEIIDMNGRTIRVLQGQTSYDISYADAAVYFIRVYTDQGVQMKRLIKQ